MNGESSSVRISPKHEGVVEISDYVPLIPSLEISVIMHCLYRNRSDDDKRRKLSPLERNNTISNLEEQRELKLQDMWTLYLLRNKHHTSLQIVCTSKALLSK
ncbi:hypothetical protein YC2023_090514 [Brassica napus]